MILLLLLLASIDELPGRWVGTSICTDVRPACKDEVASYRITPKNAHEVTVSFNKMVKDEEVVMGVTDLEVDPEHRTLSTHYHFRGNHLLWQFQWNGTHMRGTLSDGDNGAVIRNIELDKEGVQ